MEKLNASALAVIFVVAIAAVLFTVVPSTTGQATVNPLTGRSDKITVEVDNREVTFPIQASSYEGWGDCEDQANGWAGADKFCKSLGYAGAADKAFNPCYHEWMRVTYYWDGNVPMYKRGEYGSGQAWTRVLCSKEIDFK